MTTPAPPPPARSLRRDLREMWQGITWAAQPATFLCAFAFCQTAPNAALVLALLFVGLRIGR